MGAEFHLSKMMNSEDSSADEVILAEEDKRFKKEIESGGMLRDNRTIESTSAQIEALERELAALQGSLDAGEFGGKHEIDDLGLNPEEELNSKIESDMEQELIRLSQMDSPDRKKVTSAI